VEPERRHDFYISLITVCNTTCVLRDLCCNELRSADGRRHFVNRDCMIAAIVHESIFYAYHIINVIINVAAK
jgi:hypothetical protein